MKKEDRDKISELLGVQPIAIDSRLVSAQSRKRLYWTNIPNVTVPDDKGITLQSILEEGYSPLTKARCLLVSDSRPLRTPVKMFHRSYKYTFNTIVFRDREHYEQCKDYYDSHFANTPAKEIVCESDVFDGIRYLTQREKEKLQTMPEGYTDLLNWNQAADVLGDGWTVDVLAHIFSFIKNEE